ncbi:terpenoid cyclases/protein prenyltransferase alpha-alpha toroid [Papiliotrema laurentii]|uniref:Terpenoid cyclases/protein prenyltransferase alpha-alpha toroid n=1 Tax=Papiliotrema laurentii TaxID=5418 RepID=A0AAD9CY57_PAPLA|nr:terpenoid cyclases/protein prenyltransferase alpha-alpha toroid [Papiliotrema laurentii]
MDNAPRQSTFKRNAHIAYFRRCLQALPAQATGFDSNRITIAYFCLSGLDLLDALERKTSEEDRRGWADWIWSLQAVPGGFSGSTFMLTENSATSPPHLPSTYTALLCLALLREPLDKLNILGLQTFLQSCQAPDGSFAPLPQNEMEGDFQSDLRMTYCASVIADITGVSFDRDSARGMIARCRTWEGAFASRPGVIEAQGGTSYCAIAALSLLDGGRHTNPADRLSTIRWLTQRQSGGFQGRPGKLEDVCYSFWCGAALSILGQANVINRSADTEFLLSAQSPMGGFGKEPEELPDPFHSYLALAALSLHDEPQLGLKQLEPKWNISAETASWLREEVNRINS